MRFVTVKSIRRYLLTSLIFALTAGSFLVVIFTYATATDEIDELYDKNMMEVAETLKRQIAALNLERNYIKGTVGSSLEDTIKEEQEFLVQIWDKNGLPVYTSHRAIPYPFQDRRGANVTEFSDQPWRTYGTETHNFVIQVSQPQKARDHYIHEISFHLLYPLLFVIPVVGFFLWLAIGRSLIPLNDISSAITKRSAARLEPLLEDTPIEIQPLVRELNELLARLNNSIQAQRHFIADAAHQLRTPLTALQLQLGNLKRAKTDLERERNALNLQNGIDRITHVVQQLLTLARLGPNTTEVSKSTIDLLQLAHHVVKNHADMALDKNIDLKLRSTKGVLVAGNEENIRVLLENLLSNALRYTPAGGKVDLHIYARNGKAIVDVQDNGIGIIASDRERIFERFYRVLGTEVDGTGLGLSIARNIAEQHDGTIEVGDGIDGKGTGFTLTLPLLAKR